MIATASSNEEKELVAGLGAAVTVDYKADVTAQVLASNPEGVDVALNFAGDPSGLVPAVKQGGRLVSTLIMSPADVPAEGIEVVSIYANPSPETLERLAKNQADKHSTVTVQRTYSLEQTATAFEDFTAGTLGKLVVTVA